MTDFLKSETRKNLARAFISECIDGARYQFIAQNAMQEGYKYIETLMKQQAKNEMSHAKTFYNHIQNLGGSEQYIEINAGYPFPVCDLKEGLKLASKTEYVEFKNVYPAFAKIAKDEGFKDVAESFELVAKVERCHHLMNEEIATKLNSGKLYKSPQAYKWKCTECGHEETSKSAFKTCPLCHEEQGYSMFELSDN